MSNASRGIWLSGSAANSTRELRIYVRDVRDWPLAGANIILLVDGVPFASAYESNGQAMFNLTSAPPIVGVLAVYGRWNRHALLGSETDVHTFHIEEVDLMKDRIGLWVGLGLWAISMILAFVYKQPNALQENLIRASFSLGAGGIASVIPGMLNAKVGTGGRIAIAATGALAVWLITFLFVPGKNPLF